MMRFLGEKSPLLFPLLALALICAVAFSLMLWASFGDSAIMDELAHIPAGYGYVHNLDYRLNPEHPPLVKALAALPLLFLNPNFPTNDSAWTKDINGQWTMGAKFLYESGNDANLIVRAARMGPILLTLLLIILIYFWSRELLGNRWALLPALLAAFSPTILAHGHYVTTDIGAALGILSGTYFFLKFLFAPSKRNLFFAGIAFGMAQLMKFSVVLLIPYFFILIAFFFASTVARDWKETDSSARLKRFSVRAWRYFRSVIAVFLIGYFLVVYPLYFLFTLNYPIQKQVSDTEFTLASFADGPPAAGKFCKPLRCVADFDIWMSKNPVTRPFAEYLLGVLMVTQRASGGNTNYFLGEVSSTGTRLYFPVTYLLKEPLPALFIVFIALLLGIWAIVKRVKSYKLKVISYFFIDYLGLNFAEFSMIVFILFYWAYSMKSPLNIGFRHLMPTIPLIYILAASSWKRWLAGTISLRGSAPADDRSNLPKLPGLLRLRLAMTLSALPKLLARYAIFAVLLIWLPLEAFFSAPYFLSYFNELGGGTRGGYRVATDSNYDWGQDLLRLQTFVDSHPEIDKIAVDYFGGGSPKYYLGEKEIDWRSSLGNPSQTQINADENADKRGYNISENLGNNQRKSAIEWLAVSINTLESATQPLALGQNRNPDDEYRWLTSFRQPAVGMGNVPEPDFKAGTSIFIYKL